MLTLPPVFTDEDEDLKNKLLDEGWSTWNKKDFFNFVRMAEKYGRDGIGGRGYLDCSQTCCKKNGVVKCRSAARVCFNRKCAGICYDFTTYLEALAYKTVEEILDYAEAFWQQHSRIENGQKYIERIEKGESDIERRRLVDLVIKMKFDALIKIFNDEQQLTLEHFTLLDISLGDEEKDAAEDDIS